MRLNNQKSPGEDGIQEEIIKILNDDTITNIHKLIVYIWEKKRTTTELECCSNMPNL